MHASTMIDIWHLMMKRFTYLLTILQIPHSEESHIWPLATDCWHGANYILKKNFALQPSPKLFPPLIRNTHAQLHIMYYNIIPMSLTKIRKIRKINLTVDHGSIGTKQIGEKLFCRYILLYMYINELWKMSHYTPFHLTPMIDTLTLDTLTLYTLHFILLLFSEHIPVWYEIPAPNCWIPYNILFSADTCIHIYTHARAWRRRHVSN